MWIFNIWLTIPKVPTVVQSERVYSKGSVVSHEGGGIAVRKALKESGWARVHLFLHRQNMVPKIVFSKNIVTVKNDNHSV